MPGRRLPGGQVFICDLGYTEGVTPLVTPPAETPECEPHTPHPAGYIASASSRGPVGTARDVVNLALANTKLARQLPLLHATFAPPGTYRPHLRLSEPRPAVALSRKRRPVPPHIFADVLGLRAPAQVADPVIRRPARSMAAHHAKRPGADESLKHQMVDHPLGSPSVPVQGDAQMALVEHVRPQRLSLTVTSDAVNVVKTSGGPPIADFIEVFKVNDRPPTFHRHEIIVPGGSIKSNYRSAHSDWAGQMMKTHRQRQCKGCGKYQIWEPKVNHSAPAGAVQEPGDAPA